MPVLTSANDVREFVQYLKRRSAGVVIAAELDRSRRRLFDENKIASYRALGITTEENGLLTLSPLGWEFAKRLEPEAQGFRNLLKRSTPYWSAVTWMHEKNLDVVTTTELQAFWESSVQFLEPGNTESMRAAAVSFFSLCQAAELGTVTLGKRGHITRLCLDHEEMTKLFERGSEPGISQRREYPGDAGETANLADLMSVSSVRPSRAALKVLIIKGENKALLDLIRQTLEITGVESLTIERDWSTGLSLDNDLYQYASEYDVLLVLLDQDSFSEDEPGRYGLNRKC
ncbi:MAG TPA: hypothetical protein VMS31_11910 [Pyrinomonadaceae bacterium]|nr:hypothetical protein [Pyrinomonadaceae bacterium]